MTFKHAVFAALAFAAVTAGQAHAIQHGCVPTVPDTLTGKPPTKGGKSTYYACGNDQGQVVIQTLKLKRS